MRRGLLGIGRGGETKKQRSRMMGLDPGWFFFGFAEAVPGASPALATGNSGCGGLFKGLLCVQCGNTIAGAQRNGAETDGRATKYVQLFRRRAIFDAPVVRRFFKKSPAVLENSEYFDKSSS